MPVTHRRPTAIPRGLKREPGGVRHWETSSGWKGVRGCEGVGITGGRLTGRGWGHGGKGAWETESRWGIVSGSDSTMLRSPPSEPPEMERVAQPKSVSDDGETLFGVAGKCSARVVGGVGSARTCMTGMSSTLFMPFRPRTVNSVMFADPRASAMLCEKEMAERETGEASGLTVQCMTKCH